MDTDLVGTPSFWMEFDERPGIIISCFHHFVGCLSALSLFIYHHLCLIGTTCIEAKYRSIYDSLSWFGHSDDEGLIGFLDFTSSELFCHPFVGEAIEARDDDS